MLKSGNDPGRETGDLDPAIMQQLRRLRARPLVKGVEVGVEPAKSRAAIARPELHPGDHVRGDGAPPAAARFLGVVLSQKCPPSSNSKLSGKDRTN